MWMYMSLQADGDWTINLYKELLHSPLSQLGLGPVLAKVTRSTKWKTESGEQK